MSGKICLFQPLLCGSQHWSLPACASALGSSQEIPALAWLQAVTQLQLRVVASPLPCEGGKRPLRQSSLLYATSAMLTGLQGDGRAGFPL